MTSFSLPHFNRQRVALGSHPDNAATTDFATLLGCHSHPIASSHTRTRSSPRDRSHLHSTRNIPSYYTHTHTHALNRKVNPVSRIEPEHVEQPSPRDGLHQQQRPPPDHARSTVPPLGVIDEPERRRSRYRDHGGRRHARGGVSRAFRPPFARVVALLHSLAKEVTDELDRARARGRETTTRGGRRRGFSAREGARDARARGENGRHRRRVLRIFMRRRHDDVVWIEGGVWGCRTRRCLEV